MILSVTMGWISFIRVFTDTMVRPSLNNFSGTSIKWLLFNNDDIMVWASLNNGYWHNQPMDGHYLILLRANMEWLSFNNGLGTIIV
ncbi:hypothetical protein CEXT_754641 [Caerostris extrusa]|uniref:Bulb-type lectin domain-containing protein n=1 Tax=Caerostris extrusa TaxID=172846 RepID=A0AAV4MY01_CAEEX|nr:hypothetical protein CEXT_754641 [Caerostris extrusa]